MKNKSEMDSYHLSTLTLVVVWPSVPLDDDLRAWCCIRGHLGWCVGTDFVAGEVWIVLGVERAIVCDWSVDLWGVWLPWVVHWIVRWVSLSCNRVSNAVDT